MIYDLRLQKFRSYSDASFEFNPAVTIIVGPNASGKTNLLEAILVLARGSSYRAKDGDLLQFAADWARLDAETDHGHRTVKLTPDQPVKKSYELDDKVYKRLSLQHSLPTVLFEPNDLRLLTGSPERRRNYLDELLCQTVPTYGQALRQYKQALAQRNALLKKNPAGLAQQLFPWNVRLSQLAGQLVAARSELVTTIDNSIGGLYQALSQTGVDVSAAYESTCNLEQYETSLLHRLETSQQLDSQRGFTGSGPHRDDLVVLFDDHPSGVVASRGESRTAVLALKIIELQILEQVRQQKPLLLLDDVFSELDGARRHALTNYLTDYQTFITTTDADIALASFSQTCTVIPLS